MPTVIDELIVTVGLDASKFKSQVDQTNALLIALGRNAIQQSKALEEILKRTQQETQKRFKQTEDVARQSSISFGKFKNEVVGLFAVLSAGFGLQQFVKNVANTDATVSRMAANINISTEALSAWQQAAIRTGGSAEATAQSMLNIRNEYEKMRTGQGSSIIPFLKALHVEWTNAKGELIPMEELLDRLHKSVQGMDKTTANNLLGGLMIDQGTATFLEKADKDYNNILDTVRKLGVVTKEQAESGISYQNALSDLEQAFTTLGRVIMTDAQEPFMKFIKEITDWLSDPKNAHIIEQTAIDGLKAFGDTLNTAIGFIKEFHTAATLLAEYIGIRWAVAMTVGLGPVGAAVATIAAGFIAIQQATKFFDPEQWSNNSIFWSGMSEEEQLKHHDSPASRKARGEPERDPNSVDWMHPLSSLFGGHNGGGGGATDATDDKKLSVRDRLVSDLGISKEAAAGLVGNLNYESGLSGINEKSPLVPGSRGGFGWAQWTGDRRTQFEDYARGRGLDPKSDDANYGFLVQELQRKYPDVLAQLRRHDITAVEAADIVARKYEAPANLDASIAQRTTGAVHVLHLGGAQGVPSAASKGPSAYVDSLNRAETNPWEAKRSAANQNNVSNSSNETNINGPINVTLPNVTNSDGFAKGLGASLRRNGLVGQSNTGLQ